jgi:hypothetical protein
MKSVAAARALCLCGFLSAAGCAYGAPFSLNVPTSGERGKLITASLGDSRVTQLEGADIWFTFDPAVFSYLGATVGSATTDFSLLDGKPTPDGHGLMQVLISLSTVAVVDGIAGSLVDVSLLINQNANLGSSTLHFRADPSSDYFFSPTSGSLTVTPAQGVTVPEPVSSMLLGIGMLALLACGRSKRNTPDASHWP